MKGYKIWQAPVFAFFSTQFYRDLAVNGKGFGFVYMLLLLSFACAIFPIKQYGFLKEQLDDKAIAIIEQLPDISIENGKLTINAESPHYITDPQTGEYICVFNCKQNKDAGREAYEIWAPILVTADELKFQQASGNVSTSRFAGIDHFKIEQKQMLRWFSVLVYVFPVLIYLLLTPLAWAGHIVQALGFSLAGLLLARTISVNIKYEGILRIASFALGNVILLDAFMNIFPLNIPGYGLMQISLPSWGLYKFVIALAYTLFGVGANLSPPGFESASENLENTV